VAFGTNAATNVVVVSPTSITATSPVGTLAPKVDVTVTTAGGTSATNPGTKVQLRRAHRDQYQPGGRPGGRGHHRHHQRDRTFVAGATVTFGGQAGTSVTVVSLTRITVTAPAGTAGSTLT